ncbi:TPA: type VI secretion system baseplate subunit TssE [Legionella pneumophila]|nr:type VI secretion system baseplate subunit TssE [Legionella pneumophila]
MRDKNDECTHILLIDDDEVDLMSVQRALTKLSIPVCFHIAHDGVEALEQLSGKIKASKPKIIVLDIMMPKMNREPAFLLRKCDKDILIESIRSHIEKILSTRQGNVLMDNNYGLSESQFLVEDFSVAQKRELNQHISSIISSYEPRLISLEVCNLNTDPVKQLITFHIKGSLRVPYENITVFFTTVLTHRGKAVVKI